MSRIRVVVVGAAGRMGSETLRTITDADDMEVALAVDRGQNVRSPVEGVSLIEFLPDPVEGCDVLVEFTHAESATEHAVRAANSGVCPIIGASGLSNLQQEEVADACRLNGVGGVLVPNFAIGAVLMMRFAQEAARWLPDAEVIEMHHDRKIDAPSGTAVRTAELISEARRTAKRPDPTTTIKHEGARGASVSDVNVHSVRLPGLVAHQQVVFGGEGEVLTIKHDSISRTSFMQGVKLAIRKVRDLDTFAIGLDKLM
ncbi:MAG: 4-hydroxy-tetrahydrodipicolinate reductase [Armatimonadetes bacterium]|nr:4-hydroxy-tetrahydrodipicolinate reductase [Armatimonadota bacterium]